MDFFLSTLAGYRYYFGIILWIRVSKVDPETNGCKRSLLQFTKALWLL